MTTQIVHAVGFGLAAVGAILTMMGQVEVGSALSAVGLSMAGFTSASK